MYNVNNRVLGICISLLLVLSILLSGCTSQTKEKKEEEEESYTYVEEKITLPENYSIISDICCLEDGTIRVAANNQQSNAKIIWDSKDNGETWGQVMNVQAELNLADTIYCNVYVSAAGDIFCEAADNVLETVDMFYSDKAYYIINSDGEVSQLSIELPELADGEWIERWGEFFDTSGVNILNGINSCDFSEDGQLLVIDYMGSGYRINQYTGEILTTYSISDEMEWVERLAGFGDFLIATSKEGALFYNLDTGEAVSNSSIEEEIMIAVLEGYSVGTTASSILQQSEDGDRLYLSNAYGLYQYTDGDSIELLAESIGTVISNISTLYTKYMAIKDEAMYFLVAQDTDTGIDSLYRYTRTMSKDVYDTEIMVWSLTDTSDMRNAVSIFQAQHSNVEVNIEIGMTGEDAVTISDAIKNLNTELLAGKGPDVIFLDQMPIDSYIEKEILADLTDVLSAVSQEDGIFEKISEVYKTDGTVSAIPSRFVVMSIEGNNEAIEAAQNIETLIEYAQQLKNENPDAVIFQEDSFAELSTFFYNAVSTSWLNGDSVDKERLMDYCSLMKQIIELNDQTDSVSLMDYNEEMFVGVHYYDLARGELEIATDYIGSWGYQFSGIEALKEQFSDLSYGLINTDEGNLFIPTNIVGVNSKSEVIDVAKEFVTCLFSYEVQSQDTGGGNPVNRKAFAANMELDQEIELDLGNVTLNLELLTEEEKEAYISLVESLDTAVNRDWIIREAIFEQLEDYLDGSISLEEAVDNMAKKIDLYLVE